MVPNRAADKVFVAGHTGLVGSAIVENLRVRGYERILTRTRMQLDLSDKPAVRSFLEAERPDYVIVAAAHVGGIYANNTYRTDFLLKNLEIQNNVIGGSLDVGVPNLVFLGSSCIYPKMAPQPMPEEALLKGMLEYTNRPYALAKIAGLELVNCIRAQYKRNYFSVMPTNLYGPRDNFDHANAHVLPALLRRFIEAKNSGAPRISVWGTGAPLREFMYVDDCADAIVHLMETVKFESFQIDALKKDEFSHINVGSGQEVSILRLAQLISEVVGYAGSIEFDASKPDGTPRKLLDTSLLRNTFKWEPKVDLNEGLKRTYEWLQRNWQTALK